MATYIESALGDFVKSILTRGIRTLKSPRFFPYSAFLLLIVIITTATAFMEQITGNGPSERFRDQLLFIELAASISFVFVGIFLGRINIKLQMLLLVGLISGLTFVFNSDILEDSTSTTMKIASIFYILWIAIVAFSTFALLRDLFANETFGTVLFLGKPEDDGKVMFSFLGWLLVFLNLGLGIFVIQKSDVSDAVHLSGVVIIVLS